MHLAGCTSVYTTSHAFNMHMYTSMCIKYGIHVVHAISVQGAGS